MHIRGSSSDSTHSVPSQPDTTIAIMPSLSPFDLVTDALHKEQIIPDVRMCALWHP
jgi:hypothetical protein